MGVFLYQSTHIDKFNKYVYDIYSEVLGVLP